MNPRKSAADLSPSTFNNYKRNRKLTFTALYADCVTACQNPKLTDRAVRTWLLIQPILGMNGGYLQDDVETIARKIWFEPHQVTVDIEKLVKFDLLRRDEDGAVFDPVMVNDLDGVAIQNSAKLTKINFERCLDEQGSLSKDANPTLPQYSTVQVSTGPSPVLTTSTTGGTAVPLQTKKEPGAGAPAFFGLSQTDLSVVAGKYPDRDRNRTWDKFVNYHTKMGTAEEKITRGLLDGWFKREKPQKEKATTTTAAKAPRVLPKLTVKYRKTDINEEDPHWKIGGKAFYDEHIDAMRAMPLQSREAAHDWLSDLVGFEWDTEAALHVDSELGLFELFADNMVEGVQSYLDRERKIETKKVEKIVEQIEPPIAEVEPPPEYQGYESELTPNMPDEQFVRWLAAKDAREAEDAAKTETEPVTQS